MRALLALALVAAPAQAQDLAAWAEAQGALCLTAIAAAEARHGIPPGLLAAIGKVESGRPLPPRGALTPWPWTTNAAGAGSYYDTRDAAIAGAQAALRQSRNLDVGCMQVSLLHHPGAFATLAEAFDPAANAGYAARFLTGLQAGPAGGDWAAAAGMYHSQTPFRAAAYRARVEAVLAGLPLPRGPAPFYRRAVQRGILRLDLGDGAVRVTRIANRPGRGPMRCETLPGGAVQCRRG